VLHPPVESAGHSGRWDTVVAEINLGDSFPKSPMRTPDPEATLDIKLTDRLLTLKKRALPMT
jgi:hypothetical protein